mmetsp:Transcript_129122/g.373735  ORF Transcript_129122/g.373735 Transcript_129122/m.373735 type:complete len:201 (+) Transcript_129122:223-825(+)
MNLRCKALHGIHRCPLRRRLRGTSRWSFSCNPMMVEVGRWRIRIPTGGAVWRRISRHSWNGSSGRHGWFHGSLAADPHGLETRSSEAITFILTLLSRQSSFQKLLFDAGSHRIWLRQDSVNLFFLLRSTISRAIILLLSTALILLKDLLFFRSALALRLRFDLRNAFSQTSCPCPGLCVLSSTAIQDFRRRGHRRFDVDL